MSAALAALLVAWPSAANAQSDSLITAPTLPFVYDRDRNESVTERPRPEYDALGIRAGGFMVYPRLDLGGGYSSNIYLSEAASQDAPFLQATAGVRATSDWSRHQLTGSLSGTSVRYPDEDPRNEDSWQGALLGRYDIGNASVTGEAQVGKAYETPFSGGSDAPYAVLSSYRSSLLSLRGRYSAGRSQFQAAVTRAVFRFNDIELPTGEQIDQDDRDRTIAGGVLQAEYALSPAFSTYGQFSYARTDYVLSASIPEAERDSDGYRALAGVNFDLAALMRGTVAVGYTRRDYRGRGLDDVGGVSAEVRLEWFYSRLTTVTVGIRRVIEDASLADVSAFFDNRLSLQVDHELLNNLLINGTAEYAYQDYIGSDRSNRVYRLAASVRYFTSRRVSLDTRLSYGSRNRSGLNFEGSLDELRALATVSLHL